MGEPGNGYYGRHALHGALDFIQTMKHGAIHQKLVMYYIVTNINIFKKGIKKT